jgi:MoaA/NifB/PqqE/SkfB family radical SAM enzyme
MKPPKPSFEWIITDRCNYDCTYCFQRVYADKRHCSDATTDAVFRLLPTLEGSWLVKLIGGEPLIHPRFFEMCERIVAAGHRLCTTTNFSLPLPKLLQLLDVCDGRLDTITASLHLHEVRDLDVFVEKVIKFQAIKPAETTFVVTAVMVAEDFSILKDVYERLTAAGVRFQFPVLRVNNRYVKYDPEIEAYIAGKLLENVSKIRDRSLFGTVCHTGHLFFKIDVNGDVVRCFNLQPNYFLGNITAGTFQRFEGPQPCLARRCTCTVAANRNMILFGQQAAKPTVIRSYLGAWAGSVPYASAKVYRVVTGWLRRKPGS